MNQTVRPKLELLNESLIEKIIQEAFILLEREGIFVENEEAQELFKAAGMKVDSSTQRVYLTPQLVHEALATTPAVIKLFDRSGEKEFIVGNDNVYFDPGSAAVTILDHKTQAQRRADTSDVVNFVRVTDRMKNIEFQSTGLISQDVPEVIGDAYRMYLGLQNSTKPMVTGRSLAVKSIPSPISSKYLCANFLSIFLPTLLIFTTISIS